MYKLIIFILPFFSFAQKVYKVKYPVQSDFKVYVVDYKNQADLKVYKVNYGIQARGNKGAWFFTQHKIQAIKKIYFCEHKIQADLKIFFVIHKSQAGWINKSKKYLLE